MNKIAKQFSDLRQTTPKHIQWLLLVAAFVVVLILLTLLLRGRTEKSDVVTLPDDEKLTLTVTPDSVDWANTTVGTKKTQKITISTTGAVKIAAVRLSREVAGLATPKTTCTNMGEINDKISCTISLTYEPTVPMDTTGVSLFVDWRGVDAPDGMTRAEKIPMALGAVSPTPVIQPSPKSEPAPAPAAQPEPAPAPVVDIEPARPQPSAQIQRDIDTIAPPLPMLDNKSNTKPAPAPQVDADDDITVTISDGCSDFSFPGYNTSGQQIGWIKPERGAYYFYPFADRECKNATGKYNPDNGIITAINNPSQKIGTDAEHIGHTTISGAALPQLSNPVANSNVNRARQLTSAELSQSMSMGTGAAQVALKPAPASDILYTTSDANVVASTQPYDRSFILRQYKPIPATIVSDVRADTTLINGQQFLPVRATVDRNVYSDNGRTVIIPTGTLMLGYVTGEVPGPYKTIGRMEIKWYQFVLPNGVEFNFGGATDPFSGDAQGRIGVPGRGSTDYLEQFVMPMLTAIVPAAVNMIAPIADKFVNQIDLDNNTVVQSGTVRSSELAKNEIITAWNQVAQKLMVDMMDNTTPPFTIAAGTRITVYSPQDLAVVCMDNSKKCSLQHLKEQSPTGNPMRATPSPSIRAADDDSWIGQVRSFNWAAEYCSYYKDGKLNLTNNQVQEMNSKGIDYNTVLFYCQSNQYKAINNAKQDAVFNNQQQTFQNNYNVSNNGTGLTGISGDQSYNEDVLGLKYNDDGTIQNPFNQTLPVETPPATITCEDGTNPDANGCCTGEIYTDMGDQGFNCCPETGGDCFPPIL